MPSPEPEPYPAGPRIVECDRDWAAQACEHVIAGLMRLSQGKRRGIVMLTGGRSAERLYWAISESPLYQQIRGMDFLFGDERCVAPDSVESNYGMAMRTLFRNGIPDGSRVERIVCEDRQPESAAMDYESRIPESVDMLLLGLGRDGHIASLFPGDPALNEAERKAVAVNAPATPPERITITPAVVARAREIILLAPGAEKAEVLAEALREPDDIARKPVRLAMRATWLLDRPLPVPDVEAASPSPK